MFDINNLMKQAQGLQKKMEEMQAELEKKEFEGAAAGGMVKITINGKFDMQSINIDKSLAGDTEMMEDLIRAAFNDAKKKADEAMQGNLSKMTGGLPPGMKLPF